MKTPRLKVRALKGLVIGFVAVFFCFGVLIITLKGPILDFAAAALSAVQAPPVLVFFTPYDGKETLAVGDTATIDLDINARVPINSLGVSIEYPQDSLEVVSFSKERSFLNLWTQDTTLSDQGGRLNFSGGTTQPGGITGTSTAITITVRAKKEGPATLSVDNVQVFAADGKGTALDTTNRLLTLSVAANVAVPQGGSGSGSGVSLSAAVSRPTPPSPDINGDGRVTMFDASLLLVHLLMPYNPRYDLDMDGNVGLSDLSLLLSKIQGL